VKKRLKAIGSTLVVLGVGAACGEMNTTVGLTQLTNTGGERLRQLTNDELRASLRGASVHSAQDRIHIEGFGCDGDWMEVGSFAPIYGRYVIRDNQYCVEADVGASFSYCAKLFRTETGELFGDWGPTDARSIMPLELSRSAQACTQQ